MPPSSAGASSYEDQANSHNHDGYSAALDHGLAAPRVGDGDARHIAMKIIRMGHRKSISPINSYAESNKSKLWRKTAARGHPSPLGRISIFRRKGISGRFFTSHLSGQDGAGVAWRQASTAKCGLRGGGTIARCFCVMAWRSIGVGKSRLT